MVGLVCKICVSLINVNGTPAAVVEKPSSSLRFVCLWNYRPNSFLTTFNATKYLHVALLLAYRRHAVLFLAAAISFIYCHLLLLCM